MIHVHAMLICRLSYMELRFEFRVTRVQVVRAHDEKRDRPQIYRRGG